MAWACRSRPRWVQPQRLGAKHPSPAGYEPAGLLSPRFVAGGHWFGDGQRVRSVQHRHRPVQFPHGRPDARGGALRHGAGRQRSPRAHDQGPGRAVRLARGHRPRSRQLQRRALGPGRRGPRDGRHHDRAGTRRRDQAQRPAPTQRDPRDRLRSRDRPGAAPPAAVALPPQRHDLHRVRGRRDHRRADLLLDRRRVRAGRRRLGPAHLAARSHAGAVPVPDRNRAAPALP